MDEIFNKNIKAILFDMDGVVIDSEKLYSQSEKKLLAQYGVKFEESDWYYIKGCTEKEFYDLVYLKFDINISRKELISKGRNFLKNVFTEELKYMNGFNEFYSFSMKQYKLALVTSTGPELVDHIDSLLSIYEKFDLVITSKDTTMHKPNPDPYLIAMERLQLSPHECIIFEDSIQGIRSGKAAGSYVIALEGSLEKEVLTQADLIIPSFYDLMKYIPTNKN